LPENVSEHISLVVHRPRRFSLRGVLIQNTVVFFENILDLVRKELQLRVCRPLLTFALLALA
jgi:hypothetical protein